MRGSSRQERPPGLLKSCYVVNQKPWELDFMRPGSLIGTTARGGIFLCTSHVERDGGRGEGEKEWEKEGGGGRTCHVCLSADVCVCVLMCTVTCFPSPVAMGYRAQSRIVQPSTWGRNNSIRFLEKKKLEIGSEETMTKKKKKSQHFKAA